MKSIISFVVVVALSFIASAIAQEESPSPTGEQKASATVEETPAAMASPESKPTATSEEKTAATSPAAPKKEEPAGQKKSTAAAAHTGKMSVDATLKDNENHWEAAIMKHDAATVEPMVANDFVGVDSKGKVRNRRALLGEMKSDKDTYTSTKNEKLDVHNYGGGVAVVVGTAREKGTGKDGKSFDRSYRFTDTWMERSGQWQCIASQVSLLSQK